MQGIDNEKNTREVIYNMICSPMDEVKAECESLGKDAVETMLYRDMNLLYHAIILERWDVVQYFNDKNYFRKLEQRVDLAGNYITRALAFFRCPPRVLRYETNLLKERLSEKEYIEELEGVQLLLSIA